MFKHDTYTSETIYPLTKKTAIKHIFVSSDSAYLETFKFFDTTKKELFTVTYLYERDTHCEFSRLYIAKNRTLLSVRKDTLKKAIAHIAHEIDCEPEVLSNDLYQSLQDRGLYSVARVYHKKIFEKR